MMSDDTPPLKACVDKVFRTICSINEEKDMHDAQTKNLRVKQQKLKRYLTRRYNGRLANKLCALFDWSKRELDYKDFYMQYDQIIQNNGISTSDQMDYDTHLIALKQVAFNLYDMNCDNNVC